MVKGMSYTLEATLAGIIIMAAIGTFVALDSSSTGGITGLKEEGYRCLESIDDSGSLRSSVSSSDAAAINTEVTSCIKSAVNHEVLICRVTCTASSAPANTEKTIVNYYVAGDTDRDPAKVVLVMW